MHDWTLVEAGIFHAFHHHWITAISHALNGGVLPADYYALPERHATGLGPDVLTLQKPATADPGFSTSTAVATYSRPKTSITAETDLEFYRRKKSSLSIRHVSGDRIESVLEIISPGNERSQHGFRAFLNKVCELLENRIHLLILDLFPPGRLDPQGIHGAIWEEVQGDSLEMPPGRPLTLAAYECGLTTRAYIEPVRVGNPLPDMPLFLETDYCVNVPLETTYQTAFADLPARWRSVLEQPRGVAEGT